MGDPKVGGVSGQWIQQKVEHLKQKPPVSPTQTTVVNAEPVLPESGGGKIWNPDMQHRFPPLGEHIHKIDMFGPDPKMDIDAVRETRGAKQTELLLNFQNKLDKMSRSNLQEAQSYLVELMADPNNKDDELLGALLKTVNKELNSRSSFEIDPRPRPFPPKIEIDRWDFPIAD